MEQQGSEQPGLDDPAYAAWTGKGKGYKDKGKGKGKDAKVCVNCVGTDHIISECKKISAPVKERPCLRCLKPGHIAWYWPEKSKPANAVTEEAEVAHTMTMAYEDDYPQAEAVTT